MDRVILHSDMNNCYASIELLHHPKLRGHPIAVGGDPEARHGIVLAKDQIAKKAGVKTGMALWQARQVCPEIIFVPPHMDLYLRFSKLAREIYADYTDQQEPFGLDECWLDVTHSGSYKGDGMTIAKEISSRIKYELGVTVSIGVSWNKIFAKLGSDYKKPDAITAITKDNFHQIAWPLPVGDLLYVGRATQKKLNLYGIRTIGQLAQTDPELLHRWLGKMGLVLHMFANGEDQTPVAVEDYHAPIKSIGNSTTTPRDLVSDTDVKIIVYALAESVSARLRENNFKCRVVEISVRDSDLYSFTRQHKMSAPTDLTTEIAENAMKLFHDNYRWRKPIRSVGVRACDLVEADCPVQLDLFIDENKRERLHKMDMTVDVIRRRFGYESIQRGLMYQDRLLSKLNAKDDHTVHPRGYFADGNQTGVDLLKVSG
ncbi:MAG: DNA polymerase IV [Lachnospiraceae bacterium]|nr:DNA polymerase IV [Lachnospiraceae bacterium]